MVRHALFLLAAVCAAAARAGEAGAGVGWQSGSEAPAATAPPLRRQLQAAPPARPKDYFVEITTGTCESMGHAVIEDGAECKQAAELFAFAITWGPNGGYSDVVDGCSVRGKDSLFIILPKGCIKGSPTPEWVPGANSKATCECTVWQSCFCRKNQASGWGSLFLLCGGVVLAGYVGGGFALGRNQGREPEGAGPAGAMAVHPHISQWR